MRTWFVILGGMMIWTVQFFSLYAFGSIWPYSTTARVLAVIITLACLAAAAWLFVYCARLTAIEAPGQRLYWPARVGLAGAGLAIVSVLWQGLPAVIG